MIEYAIITILTVAVGWQTWRKRVWKHRAKAVGASHWQAFWRGFTDELAKPKVPAQAGVASRESWPNVIE